MVLHGDMTSELQLRCHRFGSWLATTTNNPGQVVHALLPLLLSSVIWCQFKSEALPPQESMH